VRRHLELDGFLAGGARRFQGQQPHFEAPALHRQLLHRLGDRFRKRLGRGLALRRQLLRSRRITLGGGRDFLLQRFRACRERQVREPHTRRVGEFRQGFRAYPKAPAGRVQRLDARFGIAQRLRVELDTGSVVAQLAHRLAGLRFGGEQQLQDRREPGVVLAQGAQPGGDGGKLRQDRALGLRQRFERRLRAGEQARAVLEAPVLLGQALPLPGLRCELVEQHASVLELGALGFVLRELRFGIFCERTQTLPLPVGRGAVARQRLTTAVRVQELALRGRPQQRLVLVLAVDVHQVLARLAQLRERGHVAVDEAARAPTALQRAAQDQAPGIALQLALGEPRGQRRARIQVELGAEFGALRPFAYQRAVGAAADQQLEGVHQDRLARAGLAGEHGVAAPRLKLDALGDDVVANRQDAQHDGSVLLRAPFGGFAPAQLLAQHGEVAVARRMHEADRVGRALEQQPIALRQLGQRKAVEMHARVDRPQQHDLDHAAIAHAHRPRR
jgi:hypothetical protein